MTGDRGPWSDERIAAAYRSRFGAARADRLETVTVDAVRRTRRPLVRVPAGALRAAIAAVVVVAVAGSATVLAPLLDEPLESTPPQGPTQSAPSGEVFFPDQVLGLRVQSVSEALAFLATSDAQDDTEIAVRGFIPPPPSIPPTCPAPLVEPTPIELRCPEPFTAWLTETAEQLFAQAENGIAASPPEGPALQYVRRVEVPWDSTGPEPRTEPTPVVLVGHFSDFRSDQCPGEQRNTCREAFVVDARAWTAGSPSGGEIVEALADEPSPLLTPEAVHELASGRLGAPTAQPWIAVLDGSWLADVDPRATLHAKLGDGVFWVVRELVPEDGRPVARTMLIDDETATIFAVAQRGVTAIAPPPNGEPVVPDEILGLEVLSVAEALAWRDDAALDDRAIAVAGWYADTGQSVECGAFAAESIVALRCRDRFRWLVAEVQPTFEVVSGGIPHPQGPALNPLVRPEVPFDLDGAVREDGFEPVILLGHFGDWRANRVDERLRFVVDAVLWRDGRAVEPQPVNLDATPAMDAAAVEARVDERLGSAASSWPTVLSSEWLNKVDPNGVAAFDESAALWRVRRLVEQDGRPVVRTAWMIDGDERIWWEAETGGSPVLVATHRVEFDDGVVLDLFDGAGQVAGVDVATRASDGPADRTVAGSDAHPEVRLTQVDPRTLRIEWPGGCDSAWSLAIYDDQPSIHLDSAPADGCFPVRKRRIVDVTFDRPVDVDTVNVVHVTTGG